MLSLHAYMGGGGSMVIMFCEETFFPTTKEYILFNYKFVENLENGNPISIPIKQ